MPTLADYPELVAQLDRKNGPIVPESISYGSGRKLWWRCPAGPDHVWLGNVCDRVTIGRGCPYCAGMAVSVTNALSKLAPAVARQWHPTKNGALRARDVTAGSHRVVWWKCPKGPDHEWRTSVVKRVRGTRCPFCYGDRVSASRNLAVAFPHLVPQWHPTLNGAVRPEDVLPGTARSFWWRCARGHEWQAPGSKRAAGRGCPFCAGKRVAPETSLAARDPGLAKEWHPRKNARLTPRDVTPGSPRRVWWRCRKGKGHEWEASIASRRDCGCPFCTNRRVSATNSLAARFPKLAREWHPTKNGSLGPGDVTYGAQRKVWWKCPAGADHAWQASVTSRQRGSGCPFCANRRVSATNSLAARFPKLAREWHPTKNGSLGPGDVTAGAARHVWWRCAFGHEWQARLDSRTNQGHGCRQCSQLRRKRPVATTGKRRDPVRFAAYEGARHGPVRRVR